jgi:CO/xanthine dehydrogenase Mo-binding subunit
LIFLRQVPYPEFMRVLTHENTPQIPYNSAIHYYKQSAIENEYVFSPVVRFVGDRVAAVAAETPELAEEALRLIEVEYEVLPAVYDIEEALAPDAPQIYPEGNKVGEVKEEVGHVDKYIKEADFVFTDQVRVPIAHHAAMEPHACVAVCDLKNKISVYTPIQNIYPCRVVLSKVLSLPMNKIRVVKPPIGGSFGGKQEVCLEPVAALLAFETKRPVKLVLNRHETIVSTRTRHAVVANIKSVLSKEGKILAQDLEVLTTPGAYASSAMSIPYAMCHKYFRLYNIPNLRFTGIPVYTNTPMAGAMRGVMVPLN